MREPEFIKQQRTKNPILRFIGNFSSLVAAWALLKYVYAEEDGKKTKAWFYFIMFKLYYPYSKWATVYEMTNKDMDEDDELD